LFAAKRLAGRLRGKQNASIGAEQPRDPEISGQFPRSLAFGLRPIGKLDEMARLSGSLWLDVKDLINSLFTAMLEDEAIGHARCRKLRQ
jgi:hypothetical protein